MRHASKPVALGLSLVLCLFLAQTPVTSQEAEEIQAAAVDFRMAPLEQAKKIVRQTRARGGATVTMTIMNSRGRGDRNDRQHLIVDESFVNPSVIRQRLASEDFDSISWTSARPSFQTFGTCDSKAECKQKTDEMCKNAGHGGVKAGTVTITIHMDGSKTCSGNCEGGGAVAFVTCDPGTLR